MASTKAKKSSDNNAMIRPFFGEYPYRVPSFKADTKTALTFTPLDPAMQGPFFSVLPR